MTYYIKDAGGNWVEGMPTVIGQIYRMVDPGGGVLESYWAGGE